LHDAPPIGIYPLSLHDALPIFERPLVGGERHLLQTQVAAMLRRLGDLEVQPAGESKVVVACLADDLQRAPRAELARPFELEEPLDRKSTRLNSVTWPSRMPSSA